jgi:hypothetical protein
MALERVQRVVLDELRWIDKLDNQIQPNKGDWKYKPLRTHSATARRS